MQITIPNKKGFEEEKKVSQRNKNVPWDVQNCEKFRILKGILNPFEFRVKPREVWRNLQKKLLDL